MSEANAPFAICSWSLRPASPAELHERVAEVGARAVQLALTPVVEDPEKWGGVIARLRAGGVEIVSGMLETVGEDYSTLASIERTGGLVPDATYDLTRARAEKVARAAGEAKIGLVTFHAGFVPHDGPARATILARIRDVASLFAAHGVAIALETGQEDAATLADALREVNAGLPAAHAVGVNFDPANMILYGKGDPVAAVSVLAPWIRQVHIKDALATDKPGTWGREVCVGTGAVEWPRFLAEVRAIGRPVRLVAEREAGEDRVGDLRAALALLERHATSRA